MDLLTACKEEALKSYAMKKLLTLLLPLIILASQKAICLPMLSSFPSAQATIFLDFDGQYVQSSLWNGGNPLNCAPSGLTDAQIVEIFNRVSEDYRPFNINITTCLLYTSPSPR